MSRLARAASLTLATRVAALIFGIGSSILLARGLGPAGKGEYALIVLIPALLQMAGGLGLDQAVVYLVARRRDRARRIVTTLGGVAVALGLAVIIVYAGVSRIPAYARYLAVAQVDPALVWVLVLLLPLVLAGQVVTSGILALERYRDFNLSSLITPVLNLALLVVLLLTDRLDVVGAVIATGAASVGGLAGSATLFARGAPSGPSTPVSGLLRESLGFGWRAHFANLAWFVHYRADMFLVGYLAGPAALGFYSIAVGLAERLYMAPSAVGTVLFPRVAAEGAGSDGRATARACRHSLWLTLALAVALAAVARPIVGLLYGSAFLPSVAPLWVLLPGVVGLAVGRVVSADLNGRGLPGTVARANGALAVVNVVLNLWWIPIWGVVGAAAATSCSYGAAAALLAWWYRRVAGARWRDLLILNRDDWRQLRVGLRRILAGGPGQAVSRESRS